MAATAQELATLKAQVITELLPTLQQFVQNQPVAQAVEKTDREKTIEKRAKEREESRAEQRKRYLDQIQKNKDAGSLATNPISIANKQKTTLNDTPRLNPANDPIRLVWDGNTQAATAANATDLSSIQNQLNALSTTVAGIDDDLVNVSLDVDGLGLDVDDLDERLTTAENELAGMTTLTLQYVSGNSPATATFFVSGSNY